MEMSLAEEASNLLHVALLACRVLECQLPVRHDLDLQWLVIRLIFIYDHAFRLQFDDLRACNFHLQQR